jgi:hypothetical protein
MNWSMIQKARGSAARLTVGFQSTGTGNVQQVVVVHANIAKARSACSDQRVDARFESQLLTQSA